MKRVLSILSITNLAVLLLLLANDSLTIAAPVIDQTTVKVDSNELAAGGVGRVRGLSLNDPSCEIEAAQTVTVGIKGALTQIDVWVGRQSDTTGDLILSIRKVQETLPDMDDPIVSFFISASEISSSDLFTYSMISIDVKEADLFFNVGEKFAVFLSAPDAPISLVASYWTTYSWARTFFDSYLEGSRFNRELQIGLSWSASAADQALRTWMDPDIAFPIHPSRKAQAWLHLLLE